MVPEQTTLEYPQEGTRASLCVTVKAVTDSAHVRYGSQCRENWKFKRML